MFIRKRVQRFYMSNRPKFTRFVPFSLKGRKMSSSTDQLRIEKRIFRAISCWRTRTHTCPFLPFFFSLKNTCIFIAVIRRSMVCHVCSPVRWIVWENSLFLRLSHVFSNIYLCIDDNRSGASFSSLLTFLLSSTFKCVRVHLVIDKSTWRFQLMPLQFDNSACGFISLRFSSLCMRAEKKSLNNRNSSASTSNQQQWGSS